MTISAIASSSNWLIWFINTITLSQSTNSSFSVHHQLKTREWVSSVNNFKRLPCSRSRQDLVSYIIYKVIFTVMRCVCRAQPWIQRVGNTWLIWAFNKTSHNLTASVISKKLRVRNIISCTRSSTPRLNQTYRRLAPKKYSLIKQIN